MKVSIRRSFGGPEGRCSSIFVRRKPAKRCARPALVVEATPRLDLGPGVGERQEPVCVETLVAQATIERFHEGVVGRLAWLWIGVET